MVWIAVVASFFTSFLTAPPLFARSKAKPPVKDEPHRFFAFDDASYYTSPDKRIGVKMLIDSARVGPTLTAMQHVTYLPGAHGKAHRHVYVTEVIYVLKGTLTLRIDKEVKELGPDSTGYIPPQTFHEYMNSSQDVCQFLQYYSPSGPEEEYRSWERVGDNPVPTKAPPTATGTKHIVRPPLPPVPGTPVTKIDNAVRDETEAVQELTLGKPPTPATNTLQLKTKYSTPGSPKKR